MYFIACDGTWSTGVNGEISCSGVLHSITGEDLRVEMSALTWDQVSELSGEVLVLFASVFAFLVLKKLL